MTHFVNSAARQVLEAMTTEALLFRLAQIEVNGKDAAKRVELSRGDHFGDSYVNNGGESFTRISGEEIQLNVIRGAWKDTMQILIERGVK